MPGSTALQQYAYPTTADPASPAAIQTLAQQIEKQVTALFPDPATRDSRWTAATGLANGAMCFIASTGELQLRSGGAWVVVGGRQSAFSSYATSVAHTFTAQAHQSTGVTFPTGRFSSAPHVYMTGPWTTGGVGGQIECVYQITTLGTGGCTIHANTRDNSVQTVTYNANLLALQMGSTSADG